MGRSRGNIRGLRDIRTWSGRSDSVMEPYRVYMRMTCLEMEKARRAKERERGAELIGSVNARFRDIEAEKAELVSELGDGDKAGLSKALGLERKPTEQRGAGGFKIKY